jgi:hypothetical protein
MSLGKPKPAQKPAQPDPANHRPGNVPTKPKLPTVIESDGGDCS